MNGGVDSAAAGRKPSLLWAVCGFFAAALFGVVLIYGTVLGWSALLRYEQRADAATSRDIQERQAELDLRIALSQTEGCFDPALPVPAPLG